MPGYIRVRKDLDSDPSVQAMASRLVARDVAQRDVTLRSVTAVTLVCGALQKLWCIADERIREDDSLAITATEFDATVGFEFCALMPARWLVILPDNRLKLPGYRDQQGSHATRNGTGAERSKRWRERQKALTRNVTQRVRNVTQRHVTASDHLTQNVSSLRSDTQREQRGTRLPEAWQPDPAQCDYARTLNLDPMRIADDFRDYWRAAPGTRGRKADWPATWRSWCRKAADDRKGARFSPQARPGNGRHTQESALALIASTSAAVHQRDTSDSPDPSLQYEYVIDQ